MLQPSDTYWNPPHSSIELEDSETTPLVGNQQQQNYIWKLSAYVLNPLQVFSLIWSHLSQQYISD